MVTNPREKSTEGFYDITKTWFDGEVDITADSPATSIPLAAMQQISSAMQQPASAMQQPAAKQQPLAAMQQPATKHHPQAVMQQSDAMQPISLAESPIFKWNSSAESPNLEDTANNDNGHIDFDNNSSMPSIINMATTGLRRSPRIAAKESEKNNSSLSCNTIMKCFCVFGVATR